MQKKNNKKYEKEMIKFQKMIKRHEKEREYVKAQLEKKIHKIEKQLNIELKSLQKETQSSLIQKKKYYTNLVNELEDNYLKDLNDLRSTFTNSIAQHNEEQHQRITTRFYKQESEVKEWFNEEKKKIYTKELESLRNIRNECMEQKNLKNADILLERQKLTHDYLQELQDTLELQQKERKVYQETKNLKKKEIEKEIDTFFQDLWEDLMKELSITKRNFDLEYEIRNQKLDYELRKEMINEETIYQTELINIITNYHLDNVKIKKDFTILKLSAKKEVDQEIEKEIEKQRNMYRNTKKIY